MKFINLATGAVRPALCVSALLSSTAVYADVTAQQVWDDWKANMGVYGQNGLTIGSEVAEGGTVTVTDLGIDSVMEGGSIKANLASIVMTENGDGTVSVTMSEEYLMTIANTVDGVETVISAAMHQTGMTMTVSGTPDELTYDVAAPKYSISLDSIMEAGTAVPAEVVVTLNNLAGSYVTSTPDLHHMDYEIGAESADVSVVVTDPETGTAVNFSGKMNDLPRPRTWPFRWIPRTRKKCSTQAWRWRAALPLVRPALCFRPMTRQAAKPRAQPLR